MCWTGWPNANNIFNIFNATPGCLCAPIRWHATSGASEHALVTLSNVVWTWPNACNISTQHFATLLGTTCCIRLPTLLRYIATCWMLLDQIWKRSNFLCNIFDIVRCWVCLATYTQHCGTTACALGPLVACQGPWTHQHPHLALEMLRAFGRLVQHLSQHHATMLADVALKCCERLARPLGFYYWTSTESFVINICPRKNYLCRCDIQTFAK